MSIHEKMTAIADVIRETTGQSRKLDLDAMAAGVQQVYDAGVRSEYDKFWDVFQNYGARTDYVEAFKGKGFNKNNFYPKYDIAPVECRDLFVNWNTEGIHTLSLKERMAECGVRFDFSNTTNFLRIFYYCSEITELPELDMSNAAMLDHTFAYDYGLVTIERLIVGKNTVFKNTFDHTGAIKNLIIGGTIGQNGFNVSFSNELTNESLLSVLHALADYSADTSGSVWTLTLGSVNKAKLTEAELALAENKGWVVA